MTERTRKSFDHEHLDAYKLAVRFVGWVETVAGRVPPGRAYLVDELRRASMSIALNIAEGAGELSPPEKRRFYRMAKRSATESAAIVDLLCAMPAVPADDVSEGRQHLQRIVAMLVVLCRERGQAREETPSPEAAPSRA